MLASDIADEEGANQTVTFTASPEMAEYCCQVDPNARRGSLKVRN